MPIAGSRKSTGGFARAVKFSPNPYFSFNDTAIDTDEALDNVELDVTCDADATTAIPAGSIIKIDTEFMFVTATGTTLTVVRPSPVAHDTNADIYKKVNNCVLWFPGQDDAYSATIRDRSGNGNNGTIAGATWVRLGSGLWVLSFDGTDDVIDCGSAAVIDDIGRTGDYTFSILAWVKPITLGETSRGRIVDVASGFFIVLAATATVSFDAFFGAVDKQVIAPANSLPLGTSSHVAAVYNGVNLLIYTNLSLTTGGDALSGAIDAHAASSLLIGDSAASNRCFNGLIGEVRVYNRDLSASEIANIYNQERHLFGV